MKINVYAAPCLFTYGGGKHHKFTLYSFAPIPPTADDGPVVTVGSGTLPAACIAVGDVPHAVVNDVLVVPHFSYPLTPIEAIAKAACGNYGFHIVAPDQEETL